MKTKLTIAVLLVSVVAMALPLPVWVSGVGTLSTDYSPNSKRVIRHNTAFLTEIRVGDYLGAYGRGSRNSAPITFEAVPVVSIESDTQLTLAWRPAYTWVSAQYWWYEPVAGGG